MREMVGDSEAIREPAEGRPLYEARCMDDPESVVEIRRFIAAHYLASDQISRDDLDQQGLFKDRVDPRWRHSVYFGVFDADHQPQIASRLILPTDNIEQSLQLNFDDLYPGWRDFITERDPHSFAEFSSYAKVPGARTKFVRPLLLQEMARYSREHDIKYWVADVDPRIVPMYHLVLPGIVRIGAPSSVKVELEGESPVCIPYLYRLAGHAELTVPKSMLAAHAIGETMVVPGA